MYAMQQLQQMNAMTGFYPCTLAIVSAAFVVFVATSTFLAFAALDGNHV